MALALTKAREAAGYTRFRLGSEAGIHPSRVGQFENGRAVPYPVELQRLADALGWSGEPSDLLKEVGDDSAD